MLHARTEQVFKFFTRVKVTFMAEIFPRSRPVITEKYKSKPPKFIPSTLCPHLLSLSKLTSRKSQESLPEIWEVLKRVFSRSIWYSGIVDSKSMFSTFRPHCCGPYLNLRQEKTPTSITLGLYHLSQRYILYSFSPWTKGLWHAIHSLITFVELTHKIIPKEFQIPASGCRREWA